MPVKHLGILSVVLFCLPIMVLNRINLDLDADHDEKEKLP